MPYTLYNLRACHLPTLYILLLYLGMGGAMGEMPLGIQVLLGPSADPKISEDPHCLAEYGPISNGKELFDWASKMCGALNGSVWP